MRGGWGLDALGKFFRRRRRRRRRRRPPVFGKRPLLEFYYGIGASGVRGSIRLVFRSTDARNLRKVVVGQIKISKNNRKQIENGQHRHSIKIPYRNIPYSYPLKGAVMYN